MLLRHSYIVIYTTAFVLIAQSFIMHTPQSHTYTVQFPLFPLFPLLTPFCLPLVPPFTYSQVVCKLTPFAPLHPVDPPFPNSRPPTCPTSDNDDLGNILALSVQNKYVVRLPTFVCDVFLYINLHKIAKHFREDLKNIFSILYTYLKKKNNLV